MAVVKFVQFMTVVLGVLFAHLSLVPAEGLTRLELGLRVIIQNKLACLMSYMALKSIVLYGRIAELMFEVSEDTLSGIVVIYICIYTSTMGVIEHMCLQQLFKFTIGTQIPIIVVLTYLIISGLLNTVFLIMACLWLMLSVTLFVAEIISAFRHIDDLYAPAQKEPLKGVTVEV
ncbi:Hypp7132 [Branchiostoma lanceolatum]|nr:Hypp7132 [Branchiostoma lanceolatum]